MNRFKLAVLAVTMSACLPLVVVRSSPCERIFLKKPIFGNLVFASDLTIDSLAGGKYRTIDHPYIYINTGESVKCLEPESGRLAQTVPFDPATEEPYSAVNTGICFIKTDQNGARFFELKRYDGTQILLPQTDRAFMVYWEPKPVIFRYDPDESNRTETITAVDENGQTLWEVDGLYSMNRDSNNRYWFKTKDGWFLVDPQTGKALANIPKGFGFVRARGSLAYLLHESKVGVSGIFNIDTGKLVHECKDSHHTIGKDGFLCYKKTNLYNISNKCYDYNLYSLDGKLIVSFQLDMPKEFEDCCHFIISFYERHIVVSMTENNIYRLVLINTDNNRIDGRIDLVYSCDVLDDAKLFFLGDRSIGAIDLNSYQQIWSMPIGNSYLGDDVTEKDFGKYKLVGRRIDRDSSYYRVPHQVKIVDKADGFVEPFEFEFENGGLRNCYETDYGFININGLSQFSIFRPQISFYRRGSIKAVGTIDYIGKFDEKTISVKDGRYLTANLSDGETVTIDCRLMTFQIKKEPTASNRPSFQ